MRMPESFLSRMILACMPFLAYGFIHKDIWKAAALAAGVYWLSIFIFWFTRRLFPERTSRPVFFLWLGLWGQLGWNVAGLLPFWTASVFLLVPAGFFDEGRPETRPTVFSGQLPKYFAERTLTGLGFFVSVCALETAKGLVDRVGHPDSARSVAAIFFLLFLVSFIWKNQPQRTPANNGFQMTDDADSGSPHSTQRSSPVGSVIRKKTPPFIRIRA